MTKEKDTVDWRYAFKGDLATRSEGAIALCGLRSRERLTQLQVAKYKGLSQDDISAIENGQEVIDEDVAKRLRKIFNFSSRMFLG